MTINLWLGLYNAPNEWPWTYMFLVVIQLIYLIDPRPTGSELPRGGSGETNQESPSSAAGADRGSGPGQVGGIMSTAKRAFFGF